MRGLLSSRKGTLCLLIVAMMSVLGFMGKIDGMAFAGGCSLISAVFCYAHAKTDVARGASHE